MVAKVVDTYGKLDACYNNAGIAVNAPAEEMTFEQWQKVIDINLTGVFLCATPAGRVILKQGYGSIINTASMSGHIVNVPQPQCAYNASKAGVSLLTKSLAVEWAACKLHQPRIYWHRSYHECRTSETIDRAVECNGSDGKAWKTGRITVYLSISGWRHKHIYNRFRYYRGRSIYLLLGTALL